MKNAKNCVEKNVRIVGGILIVFSSQTNNESGNSFFHFFISNAKSEHALHWRRDGGEGWAKEVFSSFLGRGDRKGGRGGQIRGADEGERKWRMEMTRKRRIFSFLPLQFGK